MITFAAGLHGHDLAKVVFVEDGRIVRVDPAPQSARFRLREQRVASLDEMLAALTLAAEHGQIALRGKPKAPIGRRAIHDDRERGPAGLTVEPRSWVAFDWDGLPLEPVAPDLEDDAEFASWALPDPLSDLDVGVRTALRRLPPPFRDRSCVWQVTASAGLKPGWRLRTWHLLSHPCTGADIKAWLRPAIERRMVDPVTLVEAQPHYLAVKIVGRRDPCPRRFGVLAGATEVVQVPDLGALRRQLEAPRRAHVAAAPDAATVTAAERLAACVDAVAAAPDGTKHPTYVRAVARAKAICDRSGADWAPWRDLLMRTYEATLPPGEAQRRRRGSIEGAIDWVESRS